MEVYRRATPAPHFQRSPHAAQRPHLASSARPTSTTARRASHQRVRRAIQPSAHTHPHPPSPARASCASSAIEHFHFALPCCTACTPTSQHPLPSPRRPAPNAASVHSPHPGRGPRHAHRAHPIAQRPGHHLHSHAHKCNTATPLSSTSCTPTPPHRMRAEPHLASMPSTPRPTTPKLATVAHRN